MREVVELFHPLELRVVVVVQGRNLRQLSEAKVSKLAVLDTPHSDAKEPKGRQRLSTGPWPSIGGNAQVVVRHFIPVEVLALVRDPVALLLLGMFSVSGERKSRTILLLLEAHQVVFELIENFLRVSSCTGEGKTFCFIKLKV